MGAITTIYRASSTITISPENVATSSSFTSGVESNVYDNTSNKDQDVLISGKWTAGTSPTAGNVLVYVVAAMDDSPTWPDVFDGTSSAESITSANVGAGFMKQAANMPTDATSNQSYFCTFSVGQLFGGLLPAKFVIFVTHNTAVNSNSTAGNHAWKASGVSYNVA
jgi:hypothetical protein